MPQTARSPSIHSAFPVMGIVFTAFLIIGISLPTLPLHIRGELGFGPAIVGLVAGGQFCAALVSRFWAGHISDRSGPKTAVTMGIAAAAVGGLFYVASMAVVAQPLMSAMLLLLGRILIGGAESLVITGGIAWGLGLVSAHQRGKVISWIGMSMFAAYALGGPLGGLIAGFGGFWAISILTLVVPVLILPLIRGLQGVPVMAKGRGSVLTVLRAVSLPGTAFALSGVTFGAMISFVVLHYAARGWNGQIFAFSVFAGALILTRVVAGGLPDRFGGARVAIWCLGLQAIGLFIVAFSPGMPLATTGVALSGIGFSLVFPGLGIEAMARAPEEQRGLAMGTYNMFLDLTLGLGSPVLGYAAEHAGIASVFVLAGCGAVLAIPLAIWTQHASAESRET